MAKCSKCSGRGWYTCGASDQQRKCNQCSIEPSQIKPKISDKQVCFTEKNISPMVCEHTNQSVTHYSNETWIQHCESCGVVIKSGTYINENGAITNEVTTQQEPVSEVQWRDLTDEEFEDAIRKLRIDRTMTLRDWNVGRAVIAKFKAKQVGALQSN